MAIIVSFRWDSLVLIAAHAAGAAALYNIETVLKKTKVSSPELGYVYVSCADYTSNYNEHEMEFIINLTSASSSNTERPW